MNFCKRKILVLICCCLYAFATAQVEEPVPQQDTSGVSTLINTMLNEAKNDTTLVLIADLSVHGNKKTKPYIIEREVPFKQGQYMRRNELEKKLQLAQQQVMNTSLFTQVTVYVYSQHDDLVFINVDVKERWYLFPLPYFKLIDRNLNQWIVEYKASLNRTNYGLKFVQNNVTGRNDKLNINLISGYSKQVQLRYEQPFADNSLKKGFSIGFNYGMQRELNYNTLSSKQVFYKEEDFVMRSIRGELGFLYRPAIKTRHAIRLGYVSIRVNDTILKLNPNYFPNGKTQVAYPELSYNIQYYNADYNAYPTKGFIGDATIIRKGINNDMNLTQLEYHANLTIPLSPKSQVYLQSAGIIKFPFDQPFYTQQLFGYGTAYLRGMEYYVTDGVAGIMGRGTLRRQIFAAILKSPPKSKRQITIPIKFLIKAGTDMGYTYNRNPGNSLVSNKFLYTECVGMDIVIPSYDIVFKLEYSFNQFGDRGLFVHVRSDF